MVRSLRLAAVLAVTAIVAVAFVPTALGAMTEPAWTAGDYWAYAMSSGPNVTGTQRTDVVGTETVTVGGTPYPSYRTLFDSRIVMSGPTPGYVNLTGAAWYRTSDLAQVALDINGTIEMPPFFSSSIWERVTWDPPQDIQWPLTTGSAWTASTWMNLTYELGGPPPFYANASLTTSFVVAAEGPVTVPAGTFPTTPLNGTTNGYSNVTYWSPTVGNAALILTLDTTGMEMQRSELTSYRYQAGGADTTSPVITDPKAVPPIQLAGMTVRISANVTDNVGVASVYAVVRLPTMVDVIVPMEPVGGDLYANTSAWTVVGIYRFEVWASDAAGNIARANGSFEIIAANAPPTVALTSPAGGEDWSGGSSHDIAYVTADPDDPFLYVTIDASLDGGATWIPETPIPGQPTGAYTYAWTLPVVDTTSARVRVCASDLVNPPVCDASSSFTIDSTRPAVASTDPADGATDVPLGKPVTITFSEVMNQSAEILAITFSPAISSPVYGWSGNVLTISHNPFAACTRYTVTVGTGVKDASDPGNDLAAAYSWSFTTVCLPVVALTVPAGGEVWAGGSTHDVVFTVTSADASVTVWVNLSTDGGASWFPLRPPSTESTGNPVTISVTMPTSTDTTTALIRLTAQGSAGLDGTATSPPFTIDSTPPTIAGVIANPPSQIGAGFVALSATVTDNIAVASVSVNVTQPDGTHVNRTMARGAGNTYAVTSTWTQVGVYTFVIWAFDTAGNWASAPGSFTIAADTTAPTITRSAPDTVYVGDTITINATVTDPDSAVQEVRLVYTSVGGTEQNVSMTLSGGLYMYTIPAQSGPGTVRYRIYAVDPSGNARLTQEYTVEVRERPSAPGLDVNLVAGIVIVLVVLTLVAVMLVLRRRQKRRETPPASPP